MYSYLQYHWCPITFKVSLGLVTSSVRYKSRSEGMARNRRTIAGRMVHTVSICWASKRYLLVYLFIESDNIAYPTTVITRVRMISVWS